MPGPATQELRERLLSQIERVPGRLPTQCWLFQTSTGHAPHNSVTAASGCSLPSWIISRITHARL